jgi:hypothetical protein
MAQPPGKPRRAWWTLSLAARATARPHRSLVNRVQLPVPGDALEQVGTSSRIAQAQPIARAGPAKAAKKPSPVVATSRPPNRSNSARRIAPWRPGAPASGDPPAVLPARWTRRRTTLDQRSMLMFHARKSKLVEAGPPVDVTVRSTSSSS